MGLCCASLKRYKSHLVEASISNGEKLKDFRVKERVCLEKFFLQFQKPCIRDIFFITLH